MTKVLLSTWGQDQAQGHTIVEELIPNRENVHVESAMEGDFS